MTRVPYKFTPNNVTATVYQQTTNTLTGNEVGHYGPSTSVTVHKNERFVGASVPNYKEVIKSGGDATTPMTAYTEKFDVPRLRWDSTNSSNHLRDRGYIDFLVANVPVDQDLIDIVDQKAQKAFYDKCRSGFDSLTFLGELGEAIAMIKRPASAIRKSAEKLRLLNYKARQIAKSASEFRRAIAGTVLEYQMGWKPLMNDVNNAAEVMDSIIKKRDKFVVKYASSDRSNVALGRLGPYNVGYQSFDITSVRECNVTVIYRGLCSTSKSGNAFDRRFGTSIPDMLNTGWQLLPYSFLIDYMVNIGDLLDQNAAMSLTGFDWVNKTIICDGKTTCQSYFRPIPGWTPVPDTTTGSYSRRRIDRFKNPSLVLPDYGFQHKFSSGRALNIAALVSQFYDDLSFKKRK